MPKIPEISVGIQTERSVLVSSERNIRDHLWRWSTHFGRNIPKLAVPFLINRFFVLIGEFGKGIKSVKSHSSIPIGWSGLFGKCRSIFLGYRGFARQLCCMAGTKDSFSYGKRSSFLCKTLSLFLPCKTSIPTDFGIMESTQGETRSCPLQHITQMDSKA